MLAVGSVRLHSLISAVAIAFATPVLSWADAGEEFYPELMPAGIRVEQTDMEGPVFADAEGRTLYRWEAQSPTRPPEYICSSENITEIAANLTTTAGVSLRSFPGKILLPEPDKRLPCAVAWPSAKAPSGSKPIGKWTIVVGQDGSGQWAYEGYPLYTSRLDEQAGDVFGGTGRWPGYAYVTGRFSANGAGGRPERTPIGPKPRVPPGFNVVTTQDGRLITTDDRMTVYTSDADRPSISKCDDACAATWRPLFAPYSAVAVGAWSTIERGRGVKQWAFKGKPLYTNRLDTKHQGLEGTDTLGWRAAYVSLPPKLPADITIQQSSVGEVMADSRGRTLYYYDCTEPTSEYLKCNYPDTTQVYRFAICGGGDPATCSKLWPMVPVSIGASSEGRLWSIVTIDPSTGHSAPENHPGAVRVWAYRKIPVYTFADDKKPGDVRGDAWGGFWGAMNGYSAIRFRDSLFPASLQD